MYYSPTSILPLPLALPPPSLLLSCRRSAITPVRPIPSWYHHMFATHVPSIRTIYSQRSKNGRVAMYCTTVLSLFSTYASISPNRASCIAVSRGGYYNLLSNNLCVCLPVIHLETLCWNPPRARTMRGVITHTFSPKSSTAWTTAFKKIPNTLGFYPSFTKVIGRCAHLFLALLIFPTTDGQSPSKAVMIRPKYF